MYSGRQYGCAYGRSKACQIKAMKICIEGSVVVVDLRSSRAASGMEQVAKAHAYAAANKRLRDA